MEDRVIKNPFPSWLSERMADLYAKFYEASGVDPAAGGYSWVMGRRTWCQLWDEHIRAPDERPWYLHWPDNRDIPCEFMGIPVKLRVDYPAGSVGLMRNEDIHEDGSPL